MLSDISLVRRPSYGLRDQSLQGKVGVCVMNTVTYINILVMMGRFSMRFELMVYTFELKYIDPIASN